MLRLIAVHNARKKLEKYAWRYAKAQARRRLMGLQPGPFGLPTGPATATAPLTREAAIAIDAYLDALQHRRKPPLRC